LLCRCNGLLLQCSQPARSTRHHAEPGRCTLRHALALRRTFSTRFEHVTASFHAIQLCLACRTWRLSARFPCAPTSNQFVSRTPRADGARCAAPASRRLAEDVKGWRNAQRGVTMFARSTRRASVAAVRVCLRLALAIADFSIATFASAAIHCLQHSNENSPKLARLSHAKRARFCVCVLHVFSQGFSYTVQRSSSANSSARWLKGHFQPEFSQG